MMGKAMTDALVIARLDWLRAKQNLLLWTIILLSFPLAMQFIARNLTPPGVEIGPRLIAGSIVFTLGISIVQGLAQDMNFMRFTYRLTLIRSCPVHPFSYAAGSLVVPVVRSGVNACFILLFAPIFGIDIHLSPWFLPVALFTALSLSGLAFIIGTWSPSQEIGNMISNIVGILVVMLSPIYFPLSRLPDWMEVVARVSPYTYAADAFDAMLSGRGGFFDEIGILAVIAAVSMSIGLAGMRWREV